MSGTSAAADEGVMLPRNPKQRHSRARTGCERCRAQHRKCDEAKPKCRRCADAGVACKYITHISFLDKNSQTSSIAVTSRPPSSSTTLEYPVLEFVVNNDSTTRSKNSGSVSTFTNTDYTGHFQDQRLGHGMVMESGPVENSIIQGLGDGNRPLQKDAQSLKKDELRNTEDLSLQYPSPDPPRDLNRWDNSWPLVGRSSLSDEEVVLLKYYGHHVAPWLDIYDPSQPFRHIVTRLAMDSPCVLEAILHLSAACSGRPIEVVRRRGVGSLHLQAMSSPLDGKSPFAALRLLVSFVLVRTLLFVQDVPGSWEASFGGGGIPSSLTDSNFVDAAQRSMWLNVLVLISRLEIAYSLMNQTAPTAISGAIRLILSPPKSPETSNDQRQNAHDASLNCLGLLADVMNLCLPPQAPEDHTAASQPTLSTPVSVSRATLWKDLLHELCTWSTTRPPELQPLTETEARDAAFPTVIFASGAGISSNTLYHTAMHLLLTNKPQQSISPTEPGLRGNLEPELDADKARLSPLWHARRVCGIALHSEPEHTKCWDPCMIAAFALVARRMTHMSQQDDVLACLGRIKVAGWNVDGLVRRLRDEWGPVG